MLNTGLWNVSSDDYFVSVEEIILHQMPTAF